jgi:single-strand DNA-binding protein
VELHYTTSGTPVGKFCIAFDRCYQKDGEWQQETSFLDVVVWSKKAEKCSQELHKGSPVMVEGYIQTRIYTDKENQNRKVVEIVANRVHLLEKSPINMPDTQQSNEAGYKPSSPSVPDITDDDVPF